MSFKEWEWDGVEKINILVFGESGVGKSTLINAILGSSVAETGIGGIHNKKNGKI